jgi:hypothetical protein
MVSLKAAPKFHQISSYVANPFRAQLLWGKYLGSGVAGTGLRAADVWLGNRYYQETIIRHVGSKTSTGQIFVSLEVHTHFQFGQWSIPIFEILLKILKSPKCISYKIISYHTHTYIYIYICRYYDKYIIYINPIISNFLRRNPLVFRWWCQESIPGAHRYWRWAHLPPPHRAKWCSPDAHLLWDGDPNAKPKRATGIPNIIRLVWGILVGGNYSLDMFIPSNQILYRFGDVLHIFA